MPHRADVCPTDMKLSSMYCYSDCPEGYDSENGACFKRCPKGFEQGHHNCRRPPTIERAPLSKKCDGCVKEGEHWFKKSCPAGYKVSYTGSCIAPCPEGTSDAGHLGCLRKYGARTYSRAGCPEGHESQGFMCWKKCPKKADIAVGPMCWGECPADKHACLFGSLCVDHALSCADVSHSLNDKVALTVQGFDLYGEIKETTIGKMIGDKHFGSCNATTL